MNGRSQIVMCDMCHRPIKGNHTYDVWLSRTVYTDDGEPNKTGEDVRLSGGTPDYIVVGALCCGQKLLNAWTEFAKQVIGE